MAAIVASNVEERIRTVSDTKRIRPSEFFLDFDRLRSGFVTESQFFRVLWKNLGVKLTEDEQAVLSRKYRLKGNELVNYRNFCDIIELPFDAKRVSTDPAVQKKNTPEIFGTWRSIKPLSEPQEERLEQLLRRLAEFYRYRGINLRTVCEDFDRHHMGVINQTQFYRSFPCPADVKEDDIELLVRKYMDQNRPEQVNYLNLHHDLMALTDKIYTEENRVTFPQQPPVAAFMSVEPGADQNVQNLIDRVRVAAYKNGIRTLEFFRDYDSLRSGLVTEHQFICGLSLAIGTEAQLTRPELQKLTEFYKTDEGSVRYKDFCDLIENSFTIPHLEKTPMQEVLRPGTGALGRNLPGLTEEEEDRLQQVLGLMAREVKRRRLMMYQYFKDYDRSKAYSRVITPNQFARILHFLTLKVAPEEFKLLRKKFEDPASGDINYPAFVQTVDPEFLNYKQDEQQEERMSSSVYRQPENSRPAEPAMISLEDLMSRIRHHVLTTRRRVIEYFQDFDQLRSGTISRGQFKRGLSDLGLSLIGQVNLSDTQFDMLADFYTHPKYPDLILWTQFQYDIESVLTQTDLEKIPTHRVPKPEMFLIPRPGVIDWRYATEEHKTLYEAAMARLSDRAENRRVMCKPVFQDFDRHNKGHVTRGQFRQALNILELHLTEEEMKIIEAKHVNDDGFNYRDFLQELQPVAPIKPMYEVRLREIRATNEMNQIPEINPVGDMEMLLFKIKNKVFKERARIHEWVKDYDKLRTGRMTKTNFRRALDLCKFEIKESEFAMLEDHYQSLGYPDFIDYQRFSDEIERIFTTKNLEKAPLDEIEQYKPPMEWKLNNLEPDLQVLYDGVMQRLTTKVRERRIQLFPLFEDFDRVKNGRVSQSQFRRVLQELELSSLFATENEWNSLYKKFEERVGTRIDVNYQAFCDTVYAMAKFEWRLP